MARLPLPRVKHLKGIISTLQDEITSESLTTQVHQFRRSSQGCANYDGRQKWITFDYELPWCGMPKNNVMGVSRASLEAAVHYKATAMGSEGEGFRQWFQLGLLLIHRLKGPFFLMSS